MSKKEWLKNLDSLEALNQLKNIPIYETSMYGDKYYYEGRLYDIYIYKRMVNIIKHDLEDYKKLLKIEYRQNTINDFYPNTKEMIDDLLNLVCSKMCDFLKEGETYTKSRMLELLGTAIRYVKTFAYGGEFNETEKVGVNAKKLKALEIIKEKTCSVSNDVGMICDKNNIHYQMVINQLTQEEYDLLKEILL